MMSRKVSVIITIYNEEKYIAGCLASLAEQNWQDFEIIVIDDGSTDKTYQILPGLQTKNYKLRTFRQKHQGLATARNLGARYAQGEIVVFLDGDMVFSKTFLKDLIEPILAGKTKGTYSTEEYVANWDNVWARCWNYNWNLPKKKRIDSKRKDQQQEFRAILKKEYDRVGGLDNIGYTDSWTLPKKLGYRPTITKALYYHYNPSNLSEVFSQAKWTAKRKYKFGKLGKIYAFLRANPLFSLIIGLYKSIIKKEPAYLIFKLCYDFGFLRGLLEKNTYA